MFQMFVFPLALVILTSVMIFAQSTFVLRESMREQRTYKVVGKPSGEHIHEVVVSIKKKNIDVLERKLLDELTEPGHSQYQNWLTFDEVNQMTHSPDSYNIIKDWLGNNSVSVVWESASLNYLKAHASISVWESLLDTEFFHWKDDDDDNDGSESDKVYLQSKKYSLPDGISKHVDTLFYVCHTPVRLHLRKNLLKSDTFSSKRRGLTATGDVSVAFLNSLYKINSNLGSPEQNQSVFETGSEYFSTTDLRSFQQMFGITQQEAISVGNHALTNPSMCSTPSAQNSMDCFEGNLDLQYLMGISQLTSTIYWYIDSTNPFVDWILAVGNEPNPPLVNSVSWGTTEQSMPSSTMSAFCNEAMSLASRGVTIVVSSGDNGVAGTGSSNACSLYTCTADSGSNINSASWSGTSWTGKGYFPSFPATCPYVTSVGATMGPESGTAEIACQSNACYISGSNSGGVITSGGGFSTYFAQPSWQTDAVSYYFGNLTSAPESGYNRNGRGYPDISLIGVKYQVVVAGALYQLYGTSASAPVFAGMISLINSLRAKSNRTSIGWINRSLYESGMNASLNAMFNDIISGDNKCCSSNTCTASVCCDSGFSTSKGWDPVTGFGSINFDSFAGYFDVSAPYVPTGKTWGDALNLSAYEVFIIAGCVLFIVFVCPFLYWLFIGQYKEDPSAGDGTVTISPLQQQSDHNRPPSAITMTNSFPRGIVIDSTTNTTVKDQQFRTGTDSEPCPVCGTTFEDPILLVEHMDLHNQNHSVGEEI